MKSIIVEYFLRTFDFFLLAVLFMLVSCKSPDLVEIEEYRKLRIEKLNQLRPVIHNNDGNDATVFPIEDYEFSISNFLKVRSEGLIGSDVSIISYNTGRSFSLFKHNSEVGEISTDIPKSRTGIKNIIPELIELGTDPLEVTCNFAHENGFDFFCSMRMNDTHDSRHRVDNPDYLFPKLKKEHPEYLFGSVGEKLPHGRWSAVDYSHQEIRDLSVKYFTEVCENYDVDGIELDFFRHLFLFKNVSIGEYASEEQLEMLTNMVTQIREMTEKIGMKKGKPILVSVRVPDSFEYCRGVGIALKEWMERGLIDIIIGSGYFRLNYWEHMVNAVRNYDVKFYASFDESRIRAEQHPYLKRSNNAVFRARASAAWQAGVDGIYIFNEYNTRSQYLRQIGEPEKLNNTNNLYFVNYRGTPGSTLSNPNFYLKNGGQYFNRLLVNPVDPVMLGSEPLELFVEIGNESKPSDVFVILYVTGVKKGDLEIAINNTAGSYRNSTEDGLIIFDVPHSAINPGKNKLMVNCKGEVSTDKNLLDIAILFYRNEDDPELKELANLCF